MLNHPVFPELDLAHFPKGKISKAWIQLAQDGIGIPILVPVLIARGKQDGPTLGLTAAIHGDELNGIRVIQRLFKELPIESLKGTVIGVPVLNIPGALRHQRHYSDNKDLNRIMPGKAKGFESQYYAYQILNKLVKHFDYLIDLHTASFGRINSYYVRANLKIPTVAEMARLQSPQIILDVPDTDGTLRGAAMDMKIPSITIEVGNPNRFQKGMIRSGLTGVFNWMSHLEMVQEPIEEPTEPTILCESSFWLYTETGGILDVLPELVQRVKTGQKVAYVRDVFGDVQATYTAPHDGVIIGKSVMPIGETGSRILHLGKIKENS